jgi:hypothetical protein
MRKSQKSSSRCYQFQVTCERGREDEVKRIASQCLWTEEIALLGIRVRAVDVRWTKLTIVVAAEHIADMWIEDLIRKLAVERGVVNVSLKFVGVTTNSLAATEAS